MGRIIRPRRRERAQRERERERERERGGERRRRRGGSGERRTPLERARSAGQREQEKRGGVCHFILEEGGAKVGGRQDESRERDRKRKEYKMTMSIDEKIALSFQRELNGLRRHTVPKKPRVSALPDDFVAVKRELEGKKIKIKRENDMLPRKYSHRDNTYDDLPLPRGGVDLSPRNRKRSRREDEVQNPATPPLVSPHNSCSESEVELEETQINSYGNGNEFIKIKKLNKNFPIKFLLKKLYK